MRRVLGNGTPKEQYENLEKIIQFLQNLAFPEEGSVEWFWDEEDKSRIAHQLIDELRNNT